MTEFNKKKQLSKATWYLFDRKNFVSCFLTHILEANSWKGNHLSMIELIHISSFTFSEESSNVRCQIIPIEYQAMFTKSQ